MIKMMFHDVDRLEKPDDIVFDNTHRLIPLPRLGECVFVDGRSRQVKSIEYDYGNELITIQIIIGDNN